MAQMIDGLVQGLANLEAEQRDGGAHQQHGAVASPSGEGRSGGFAGPGGVHGAALAREGEAGCHAGESSGGDPVAGKHRGDAAEGKNENEAGGGVELHKVQKKCGR